MATKNQESKISRQSAKSSPTDRTKVTTQKRSDSPAKPASRKVKVQFKAGKDV